MKNIYSIICVYEMIVAELCIFTRSGSFTDNIDLVNHAMPMCTTIAITPNKGDICGIYTRTTAGQRL